MKLPTFIYQWPRPWQELFLERAAIMEFDARCSREQAEASAEQDIRRQAEYEDHPIQEKLL